MKIWPTALPVSVRHPSNSLKILRSPTKRGINYLWNCCFSPALLQMSGWSEPDKTACFRQHGLRGGEKKKMKKKNKLEKPCLLGEKAMLLCGNGFRHSCVHTTNSTGTANQGRGDLVGLRMSRLGEGDAVVACRQLAAQSPSAQRSVERGPCHGCVVSQRRARNIL